MSFLLLPPPPLPPVSQMGGCESRLKTASSGPEESSVSTSSSSEHISLTSPDPSNPSSAPPPSRLSSPVTGVDSKHRKKMSFHFNSSGPLLFECGNSRWGGSSGDEDALQKSRSSSSSSLSSSASFAIGEEPEEGLGDTPPPTAPGSRNENNNGSITNNNNNNNNNGLNSFMSSGGGASSAADTRGSRATSAASAFSAAADALSNNDVLLIGITGGIATGKSTAAARLRALCADVLDADTIGHEVYEPGEAAFEHIVHVFGRRVVDEHGRIDRRALGAIVFADALEMRKLTNIVWPELWRKVGARTARLAAEGKRVVFVEAAVLVEAGWSRAMGEVWLVDADTNLARTRLMARNKLTEQEANTRLAAQVDTNAARRRAATTVIVNDNDLAALHEQVDREWARVKAARGL